jgi:hypothetical protein
MNYKKTFLFTLIFSLAICLLPAQAISIQMDDSTPEVEKIDFKKALQKLVKKAEDKFEECENAYFSYRLKQRFNKRVAQIHNWVAEQPLTMQVPLIVGTGVAAYAACNIAYYTLNFIPSFICHPLTTTQEVLNGDPSRFWGALGTGAALGTAAHFLSQEE